MRGPGGGRGRGKVCGGKGKVLECEVDGEGGAERSGVRRGVLVGSGGLTPLSWHLQH